MIMEGLITELSRKRVSGTVIPVDEYDSQVSRRIDDMGLAEANA
jgi:hypothetical protein